PGTAHGRAATRRQGGGRHRSRTQDAVPRPRRGGVGAEPARAVETVQREPPGEVVAAQGVRRLVARERAVAAEGPVRSGDRLPGRAGRVLRLDGVEGGVRERTLRPGPAVALPGGTRLLPHV